MYHCHILAHEEMDMMHAMCFAVPPKAPTNLAGTVSGKNMVLSWTDNSRTETGFVVERAGNPSFTGFVTFMVGPNVTAYTDTSFNKNQVFYYRVAAVNTVG